MASPRDVGHSTSFASSTKVSTPAPSVWAQLFGCACAPDDNEIKLVDVSACGGLPFQGCTENEVDDDVAESLSFRIDEPHVGGLNGMAQTHPEDMVFQNVLAICEAEESPEQELVFRTNDFVSLCSDLLSEKDWKIEHLHDDSYSINGRDVCLFLLPLGSPSPISRHLSKSLGCGTTRLAEGIMVRDGPLCQPLLDYLMHTGLNEFYDCRGIENPAAVTGAARKQTFATGPITNDRVEAMLHATAQASLRQRLAQQSAYAALPKKDGRQCQTKETKTTSRATTTQEYMRQFLTKHARPQCGSDQHDDSLPDASGEPHQSSPTPVQNGPSRYAGRLWCLAAAPGGA